MSLVASKAVREGESQVEERRQLEQLSKSENTRLGMILRAYNNMVQEKMTRFSSDKKNIDIDTISNLARTPELCAEYPPSLGVMYAKINNRKHIEETYAKTQTKKHMFLGYRDSPVDESRRMKSNF